eukprot:UN07839
MARLVEPDIATIVLTARKEKPTGLMIAHHTFWYCQIGQFVCFGDSRVLGGVIKHSGKHILKKSRSNTRRSRFAKSWESR